MLLTNILICSLAIIVIILMYSLNRTQRMLDEVRQRGLNNFALFYQHKEDTSSCKGRVEALSEMVRKYGGTTSKNEDAIKKIDRYIDGKANCLVSLEKQLVDIEKIASVKDDIKYIISILKSEGIIKDPLFQLPSTFGISLEELNKKTK